MTTSLTEQDLCRALLDPASVFNTPNDVTEHTEIELDRRIEILRRWEYDAREMQVADEEGLPPGNSGSLLDDVLAALHKLGAGPDLDHTPPTKQGSV